MTYETMWSQAAMTDLRPVSPSDIIKEANKIQISDDGLFRRWA